MKNLSLSLAFVLLAFGLFASDARALPYQNSGNNTTGFVVEYRSGLSTGGGILKMDGGGWDKLPVTLTGNFTISFQVYNNSFDGDMHVLLLNNGTLGGVDVRNSPKATDTPSINLFSGTNFTDYNQFYFPTLAATLASATTQNFSNQTWTSVVISRVGNVLTDNVGGQIIQANVGGALSSTIQLGLGGYATPYSGGVGEIAFRNFSAVPEPTSQWLLAIIALFGVAGLIRRKVIIREVS